MNTAIGEQSVSEYSVFVCSFTSKAVSLSFSLEILYATPHCSCKKDIYM
jgi:hypothetical protein